MSAEFLAAVKRGDRDTVEKMLRSDPRLLETRDENGTSALLLSYYHGKAEIANSLLSHRPDLDIFEAATVGDAARIRELAARDAAVIDRVAQDGFHPLGLAAFFKRPVYRMDVPYLKVDRGAALARLIRRGHAD